MKADGSTRAAEQFHPDFPKILKNAFRPRQKRNDELGNDGIVEAIELTKHH